MPATFPAAALPALWIFELALILGAVVWLIRHRSEILPALLGLAPVRVAPSSRPASHLVAAFAWSFGLAFLAVVAVQASGRWPLPPKGEVNTFTAVAAIAFQLGLLLGLGIAWLLHLRSHRPAPLPRLPARKILRDALITFAVLLFVMGAVTALWGGALKLLGVDTGPQDIVTLLARRGSELEVLLVIISAITLAPFTEELLFRALLFRWLRTRLVRSAALFLPAFLFAFVHGLIAIFVPLAVLSVILSIAIERNGHPAVPILAHALFNLNTIVLLFAGLPA